MVSMHRRAIDGFVSNEECCCTLLHVVWRRLLLKLAVVRGGFTGGEGANAP